MRARSISPFAHTAHPVIRTGGTLETPKTLRIPRGSPAVLDGGELA